MSYQLPTPNWEIGTPLATHWDDTGRELIHWDGTGRELMTNGGSERDKAFCMGDNDRAFQMSNLSDDR